ncbi:MAG: DUF86 domain-containing protein [Desulfurococcales archaeon]|nr:DUF86 domain-containing protein [Desulfurococcales archaeon]
MGALRRLYKVAVEYAGIASRIASEGSLDDVVRWLALLHALQVQAQASLDLVARLSSLLGHTPSTPVEAIEALLLNKLITREEAAFLRRVVGFRNIVVHEYTAGSREIVETIVSERDHIKLAKLVEKYSRRPRKGD